MTITHRTPTRLDNTGEVMVERLVVEGPGREPLEVVLRRLQDAGADHPDIDVYMTSGLLVWERPATGDEHQEWLTWQQRAAERHKRWEYETYIRLKAKYETIRYSDTEDMGS